MIAGKLSVVAQDLKLKLNGLDRSFFGVSIDSRTLVENNIFVAIRGENFDGHDYIDAVSEMNPACIITEKPLAVKIPHIVCKNTKRVLGALASWWRNQFKIPFLALTGTCGKTTTKQMLSAILSVKHRVLAPEKTFNNDVGVPLTLFRLHESHQFAVLECGMNQPHEIEYLAQLIKPDVAAITNIGSGHIEAFSDIDAIAKEKSDLYRSLPETGTGILNLDDRYASYFHDVLHKHKVITCAVQAKKPDVKAVDIEFDKLQRAHFRLLYQGESVSIKLSLLGAHHVMNALVAASMALAVDISLEEVRQGLEQTVNMPQRMQLHRLPNNLILIDDTYNAIPDAVERVLEFLANLSGKRVFVFGGMGELGASAVQYHEKIGLRAKELGIDCLFALGEYAHVTIESFGENGKLFPNQKQLIKYLKECVTSNANILVKGSRKSQMENVVQAMLT